MTLYDNDRNQDGISRLKSWIVNQGKKTTHDFQTFFLSCFEKNIIQPSGENSLRVDLLSDGCEKR